MMLTEVELLTTKSFLLVSLDNQPREAHHKKVVEELVASHGANPCQVYAAGFSNGAHLAYRLGMEAPGLVAGIAAVAAQAVSVVARRAFAFSGNTHARRRCVGFFKPDLHHQ